MLNHPYELPTGDAGPPSMKLGVCCGGRRRRGLPCLWCERARVWVGLGAPEAPPIVAKGREAPEHVI